MVKRPVFSNERHKLPVNCSSHCTGGWYIINYRKYIINFRAYPVKLADISSTNRRQLWWGYINGVYYSYKKEKYLVTLNKRRLKEKKVVTLWQVLY
jgi:hypothetical protein